MEINEVVERCEECRKSLVQYVYKRTHDLPESEDIVQDAIVSVWKHAHELDPDRNLWPYLLTVTRRKLIDHNRLASNTPHLPLKEEILAGMVGGAVDAMGTMGTVDAVDAVDIRRLVTKLPSHHRNVIIARFWLDLDVGQTAKLFSIPEGTVKSRTNHACKTLYKEWQCLSTHTTGAHETANSRS